IGAVGARAGTAAAGHVADGPETDAAAVAIGAAKISDGIVQAGIEQHRGGRLQTTYTNAIDEKLVRLAEEQKVRAASVAVVHSDLNGVGGAGNDRSDGRPGEGRRDDVGSRELERAGGILNISRTAESGCSHGDGAEVAGEHVQTAH